MKVFSVQTLSYIHDCIFFCHQDLRYGITIHSFHSLEENIGDICDDLQKMCFVVVFLKKKFFWNLDKSSMYLIGLTDSSKGVKLTSHYLKTNWKLSCVCVYYKQPMCWQEKIVVTKLLLKIFFPIIPIKMSGSMRSFEVWKKQTIIYKKSSAFYTIIIF